ncbi:hypothetical protein H4R99_004089 [Coemansia sp. RSA 1722]|nr:hypothetical protein H4R99_004089 [Coemansia sp. RSA 1722]
MTDQAPKYDTKVASPSSSYAPPAAPATQFRNTVHVFNPPKFAVTHPIRSENFYESMMTGLGKLFGAFGQIPGCFCCCNPYKEVPQGNIALVSRFGRYYKTADPGLVNVNPMTESAYYVDTKIQITALGSMPIVTKDNVTVGIEAVISWHINDPYLATYGVSSVQSALAERTQTTLRAVLGSRDLQDLIENRDTIAEAITEIIDKPAHDWGVTVESILIKDVNLSRELQESLSSAATQKRIGESKVIQAKAEVEAAMLMREAAEILNTPAAMQIRTLDSMVMMAKSANTKVLFVPVNQDYSNGTINAFGGAGATVGINTYGGSDNPDASADARRAGVSARFNGEKQPAYSGSSPIHDSVKDSVIYSQLTEM